MSIILDVGANVDSKPVHLEQFAVMGEIYYRTIWGVKKPRVALLSIGEEESKGNELTREASALLKQLPLNFTGNVEGRDMFRGNVDVIVCDGFIGNIALKLSEGLVEHIGGMMKKAIKSSAAVEAGLCAFEGRVRRIPQAHRLFRIRRRAAAGRSRHHDHRPWPVESPRPSRTASASPPNCAAPA